MQDLIELNLVKIRYLRDFIHKIWLAKFKRFLKMNNNDYHITVQNYKCYAKLKIRITNIRLNYKIKIMFS